MDWTASWIWHPPTAKSENFYCMARKEFDLAAVPATARLRVTGSSLYRLWINGRAIGIGPNPADPSYYYFDVRDVREHLVPGRNVIALIGYVYSEQAQAVIAQNWGRGGLLCELDDGARTIVATDATWKVLHAPHWDQAAPRNSTLLGDFKETIDTRKEPLGWNAVGFDDRAWGTPVIVAKAGAAPWTRLLPREIPFLVGEPVLPTMAYWDSASVTYQWRDDWEFYNELRLCGRGSTEKPVECKITHADFSPSILLDYGTLVTGYPEIHVMDSKGGTIELLYGETLSMTRVDRIVLRGGKQVVGPYNRRTFRYLRILFAEAPGRVDLDKVTMTLDTYPVERRGAFACSDALLEQIWEVGAHTIRMSMLDHFVDCPWRERTIYGGDIYTENQFAHYAFGDPRLNRKTLRQMFAIQYPEGAVPPFGPYSGADHYYSAWTAYVGLGLIDDYRLTGGRAFLDELWPNLTRMCDWAVAQCARNQPHLMGSPAKGGGWPAWHEAPKVHFAPWENFCFHALLARAAETAAATGRDAEARRWRDGAEKLAGAIREHLIDPATGLSGPHGRKADHRFGQYDSGLALWSGLVPRHLGGEAAKRVLSDEVRGIDSPMHGFFVLDGLFSYGAGDEAVAFIRRYWGEMLRRGATTFWEHFALEWHPDERISRGLSVCHGWSAAPVYHLPAHVGGIRALEPGFARILVAPEPADLTWADATVPTPHGDARSRWQRSEGRFRLEIELPKPGVVRLPALFEHPRVTVDGKPAPAGEIAVGVGRHVVEVVRGAG